MHLVEFSLTEKAVIDPIVYRLSSKQTQQTKLERFTNCQIATRIIALTIPLFALLDAIFHLGAALFHKSQRTEHLRQAALFTTLAFAGLAMVIQPSLVNRYEEFTPDQLLSLTPPGGKDIDISYTTADVDGFYSTDLAGAKTALVDNEIPRIGGKGPYVFALKEQKVIFLSTSNPKPIQRLAAKANIPIVRIDSAK